MQKIREQHGLSPQILNQPSKVKQFMQPNMIYNKNITRDSSSSDLSSDDEDGNGESHDNRDG